MHVMNSCGFLDLVYDYLAFYGTTYPLRVKRSRHYVIVAKSVE